jgi:GT2 family glycosyltransferase
MAHSPLVAIIVLNWNRARDTIECLDSVAELDYPNSYSLVVDNGSTDGSVSEIKAAHPSVEILETGQNLGYAEGNNFGIRHAIDRGVDYLLILNNDTLVEKRMLSQLVQVAESSSDIGMVGPTVYCADPANKLFAAGSFVLWDRGQVEHRGMFESPAPHVKAEAPKSVDFIAGCGLLVSRRLIETVGMFDPQYFLNFEDVEWGIRARRHGLKVLYVRQAIMWHKISATLGQASAANTYYMTRNGLRFFWQNGPLHLRWIAVSHIILRTLRTVGAWSLRSKYRNQAFKRKRSANILALRDFFRGRFGPMGADVFRICCNE